MEGKKEDLMKRALIFALLLIILDQVLKYSFQFLFADGSSIRIWKTGLTFIMNPGIYLHQNISPILVFLLQTVQVAAVIIVYRLFRMIKERFDSGLLLDISFALLVTGITGNLIIDRMLVGGIRDYLITPYGIANLADICGLAGAVFFIPELIRIKVRNNN